MGRAVSQVLDAREDVVVAARFDWGETADLSLCDVIIDFSTPAASVGDGVRRICGSVMLAAPARPPSERGACAVIVVGSDAWLGGH